MKKTPATNPVKVKREPGTTPTTTASKKKASVTPDGGSSPPSWYIAPGRRAGVSYYVNLSLELSRDYDILHTKDLTSVDIKTMADVGVRLVAGMAEIAKLEVPTIHVPTRIKGEGSVTPTPPRAAATASVATTGKSAPMPAPASAAATSPAVKEPPSGLDLKHSASKSSAEPEQQVSTDRRDAIEAQLKYLRDACAQQADLLKRGNLFREPNIYELAADRRIDAKTLNVRERIPDYIANPLTRSVIEGCINLLTKSGRPRSEIPDYFSAATPEYQGLVDDFAVLVTTSFRLELLRTLPRASHEFKVAALAYTLVKERFLNGCVGRNSACPRRSETSVTTVKAEPENDTTEIEWI